MLQLAFFHDPRFADLWDQLVRTFAVDHAFVVGLPEDHETATWESIATLEALPQGRVMFSPSTAVHAPGEVALADFSHPDDGVYVFGSDDQHNPAIACDAIVYIPTPLSAPLWSVQAAAIALHDRWLRGDS